MSETIVPRETIFDDSPGEEWRWIPGWPAYQVSDRGRVKSFWTREGSPRNGTLRMVVGSVGKILKPACEPKTGHWHVTLGKGASGGQKTFKNSRLVLMAFDRLPIGKEDARHLHDPDPRNCNRSNLAWGSRLDNFKDFERHTGMRLNAKLSMQQIEEIRSRIDGVRGTQRRLAKEFNVSVQLVTLIKQGRTGSDSRKTLNDDGSYSL